MQQKKDTKIQTNVTFAISLVCLTSAFMQKNVKENFTFFNGLHKVNTQLQHNRNYVVNTLKISYWQSKRFVIKNG